MFVFQKRMFHTIQYNGDRLDLKLNKFPNNESVL